MLKRTAALLISAALLAIPATAVARPTLSLAAANNAANAAIAQNVADWNALLADILANPPVDPNQYTGSVISYNLDPCDRETAYRALCDFTENYSDGTSCDDTLVVIESMRGTHEHLWVKSVNDWESDACYATGT